MSAHFLSARRLAFAVVGLVLPVAAVFAGPPVAGPNVNMVTGTQWPEGDPFLTKQNEPSLAISSRNARHLMAGANDYRLVPVEIADELDDPEAWIQIFKSVDGGQSWRGTPLGGCPINIPECNDSTGLTAALKQLKPNFGADPTVRAGPYGTFFLSFIAGTRDTSSNGVVAVQRFVDKNNDIQRATDVRPCTQGTPGCRLVTIPDGCTGSPPACTTQYLALKPAQDPILPDVLNIIDVGTPGQGKDKPWLAADVGGRSWNAGKTCELLSWTKSKPGVVTPANEPNVPAFNVYVSYANFQGHSNQPDIYVSVSKDCGTTFSKPLKISSGATKNQGTSSAIDPLTGAVYVVWRQFANPSAIPPTPDAIMLNKSTDGGVTWNAGKVPTQVATLHPYDQAATGVSMRTLGFPSVAVSVSGGVSRVHVAWTQRTVAPNATAPYACPAADPAQCDARIVVATSKDGGVTWPTAVPVDSGYTVNLNLPNGSVYSHHRGQQLQPTLTFTAGKLLATWVDSRLDQSEGYLTCKPSVPGCTSVSDMVESRRPAKNSNLDPNCHIDVTNPPPPAPPNPLSSLPPATKALYDQCNHPEAVWTPYVTDGTLGLVRRHTEDVYTAMADPGDAPVFTSSRVSQYTFGTTVQSDPNVPVPPGGPITPKQGIYDIVQKEINAPNLPMFSNGKSAFMGDYIDSAGQLIVATTGDSQHPYKFNVGGGASGAFVTSGFAPAFHVAFTDNRDVIPPFDGNWVTPACSTSAFTKDGSGNITGVSNANSCNGTGKPGPGFTGNRNQNVYTAAIVENSAAFANANSKTLDPTTERAYSVTVRNMSGDSHNYQLTLVQGPGTTASFHSATPLTQNIIVQPRSSSARTVWVKGSSTGTVEVDVKSTNSSWVPDGAFVTKVLLNPDATCATLPGSSACAVTNGDGGPATSDTAPDNFGNVVMSNAVMTNYLLANNPLTTAVMSNNAMTNAAMSNVVFSNAAMSNDPAVNAAMSNVVMSNVVMSNNAMTNAVMSNVVMTNNTLNAAMTNLDPANVAMSNAVMSNNAMTNVALTNGPVGNVVMTNNAMTNAVMSNVAMSNVAMTNNAMTNDPLRYVAMTNAPLSDTSGGTVPDADPLRSVEVGAVEIAQNPFQSGDLANSNFKETTFAIRNRGNVDTTLAIKMMLRDAICSGAPNYTCTTPPGYKLQLVLRKVSMLPVAIPPTGPAVSTSRAIRIGLTQSNVEVSNVSALPLVDPTDPNFGKFLPDDPNAAMLTLAPGDYAYATVRAIGVGGAQPPDPADLLQWGVKTVASNATNANGPLVIRTLNFPAAPAFVALTPASPTFQAFGGKAPITGSVACSDKFGNIVLSGVGAPTSNVGVDGNFYIDTQAQWLYGPRMLGNWGSGASLIVNGPNGPQASVPCPPGPFGAPPSIGAFTTDAFFNSTANITFTPTYWGDFYLRTGVADASSPTQTDQQVIKVTVQPHPTTITFNPPSLVYNNNGAPIDLRLSATSDRLIGKGVLQPIVFSATGGACHLGTNSDANYQNYTLFIDAATGSPPSCVVTATQAGNEIYAPAPANAQTIFIDRATQVISFTPPADNALQYQTGNAPATLVASVTSPTASPSGIAVTFNSTTTGVCTTGGANGATLSLASAGPCSVVASVGGNANYKPAVLPAMTFQIAKADQNIALVAPNSAPYNTSFMVSATSTSPTASPSGIPITFGSTTSSVCTISGATVSIVTVGLCTITADQVGNGNYNAAPQVTKNITITKADQAIVFGTAPSLTFGDAPGTVSATSTSPTAPPSGTAIMFSSQTTGVCTTGGANGSSVTVVAAGSCIIAADQAASTNYNAAPTVTQTFNIAKAPTVFTVAPQTFVSFPSTPSISGTLNRPLNPSVFPASGVTATLKKNGVIVVSPNNPYTPPSVLPNGAFTVSDAGILPENYTVTFDYAASANFLAAPSVTVALRVEGFSNAADMSVARAGHSSTLLNDGNVLVIGGDDGTGTPTKTAEVYCTAVAGPTCTLPGDVGTFKAVGLLTTKRFGHTATLLADGTVLVAGGIVDATFDPTANAEVYCTAVAGPLCTAPADVGTFKTVATAMQTARAGHTATLLPDNTVLLAGGVVDNTNPPTNTSEVYCTAMTGPVCTLPADVGKFKSAASMTTPRDSHTATLLADGTVLVTGGEIDASGNPTNTAEVYCTAVVGALCTLPADVGSFKPAASTMSSERSIHTATLLSDGRVLVAGGDDASLNSTVKADVYCPLVVANCLAADVGKFKAVGNLGTARAFHAAALLTDGFAVLAGGLDASSVTLKSSDLFDPAANNFTVSGPMSVARSSPAATRLPDGRVLVTGGRSGGTVVNSAELYNGPF